jgi:hypothetical protein
MFFRVDFQCWRHSVASGMKEPAARLTDALLSATFPHARVPDDAPPTLLGRRRAVDEVVSQRLRRVLLLQPGLGVPRGQHAGDARLRVAPATPARSSTPRNGPTRAPGPGWLRTAGFQRVACFDGDTPAGERRANSSDWRRERHRFDGRHLGVSGWGSTSRTCVRSSTPACRMTSTAFTKRSASARRASATSVAAANLSARSRNRGESRPTPAHPGDHWRSAGESDVGTPTRRRSAARVAPSEPTRRPSTSTHSRTGQRNIA